MPISVSLPAAAVFPSANDVGGAEQSIFNEMRLSAWAGHYNHVRFGYTISQEGTNIKIEPGAAMIDGRLVTMNDPYLIPKSVLHAANFDIYLQLTYDSLGNASATNIVFVETLPNYTPAPSSSVLRLGVVHVRQLDDDFSAYSDVYPSHAPWPLGLDILNTYYYDTRFEGLGGFDTTGTAKISGGGLKLTTTPVANHTASIVYPGLAASDTAPIVYPGVLDRQDMYSFQSRFVIDSVESDSIVTIYHKTESTSSGYIGFEIDNRTLSCVYASAALDPKNTVATSAIASTTILGLSRTHSGCTWLCNGRQLASVQDNGLPDAYPGYWQIQLIAKTEEQTSLNVRRVTVASPNVLPGI